MIIHFMNIFFIILGEWVASRQYRFLHTIGINLLRTKKKVEHQLQLFYSVIHKNRQTKNPKENKVRMLHRESQNQKQINLQNKIIFTCSLQPSLLPHWRHKTSKKKTTLCMKKMTILMKINGRANTPYNVQIFPRLR